MKMYIQMYFITNANRQYCTKERSAAILDQRGSRYADVTDQRYADVTDLAVRPPEHKDVILHLKKQDTALRRKLTLSAMAMIPIRFHNKCLTGL